MQKCSVCFEEKCSADVPSVHSRVNGRAHAANQSQIVLANQIFFPHEYSFSRRLPATVIPLSKQGVRVSNPPGLKLRFVDPRLTQ